MRQHTIGTTLAILFLLGLGLAASVPQAQATSLEKFPTSTSVVVAGWANPTNAYANDESFTTTSTDTAEQSFSGFGFNFNGTETLERIYVKCKYGGIVDGEFDFYTWDYEIKETVSHTTLFFDQLIEGTSGGFIPSFSVSTKEIAVDITSFIDGNYTLLNNLSVNLYCNLISTGASISVDYVSVEVAYTTEEAANMLPVGFLLATLIILPIGILIAKKR